MRLNTKRVRIGKYFAIKDCILRTFFYDYQTILLETDI